MSSSPAVIKGALAKMRWDISPMAPAYEWIALGHGSYNRVWASNFAVPTQLVAGDSYEGPWVLKYAIPSNNPTLTAMSDRDREIRLWNEINHKLPKAGPYKLGWVAPAIQDTRPATDTEVVRKLLEIYRDTRRIIVDAATEGNFLTIKATEEVILVDVDFAIKRSTSKASLDFALTLDARYAAYWADRELQKSMPKTIEMTRNLLFLEDSLDRDSIDQLCEDDKITVENVQTLTWFRTHKKPLSVDVFREISTLTEMGLTVTDTLLNALCTTPEPSPTRLPARHAQKVKAARRLVFFTPTSSDEKSTIDGADSEDNVGYRFEGI